jgi:hypothetical protein
LRRAMRKAGYNGTAAYAVYMVLTDLADKTTGIIPDDRQPTYRGLMYLCGGISSRTLDGALARLESDGWVTRHQVAGYARRTFYGLRVGESRPAREAPVSGAERVARHRAVRDQFWAEAARLVTLAQDKDVTLRESTTVTAEESTNVTANRGTNQPPCNAPERYKAQVRGTKSLPLNVSPQQTSVTTAGGAVKDLPQEPPTAPPPVDSGPQVFAGGHPQSRAEPSNPPRWRSGGYRGVNDGPCARCRQLHERYGPNGSPLCPACWALKRKETA